MDDIRQIGKYLKESSDKADYASKKDMSQNPVIERVRDLFDSTNPMIFKFKTEEGDQVKLDLNFSAVLDVMAAGYGGNGKCGDCYCTYADSYVLPDSITVSDLVFETRYSFTASSVRVYLAGVRISNSWFTTGSQEVTLDSWLIGSEVTPGKTVTIVYVYKYSNNCTDNIPVAPCIVDTFSRTTVAHEGDYYTGNNWASSDKGYPWIGSSNYCWVDGSRGIIGLHGPPDGVYSQIQTLVYFPEQPILNITMELQFSRQPEIDPGPYTGFPLFYGEYLGIYVHDQGFSGDTSDGKTVIFLGYNGQLVCSVYNTSEPDSASSTAVDFTQPFKVNFFQESADSNLEFYIWQSTDNKPDAPTFSKDTGGFSNHAFSLQFETGAFEVASPILVYVDNVDVYSMCSEHAGCDIFDRVSLAPYGGWGTGQLGTWLRISEAGELQDLAPDYSDQYENYIENNTGIIAYKYPFGNSDPAMMLRIPAGMGYPIDFSYTFYTTDLNTADNLDVHQVYVAPYFYYDIDSWMVFSGYYDSANSKMWFYITTRDNGGYNWDISYIDQDYFVIESGGVAYSPYRRRVYIDETGFYCKVWHLGAEEPASWQMSGTWVGTPPPASYFRYVIFDTQAYNNTGSLQPKLHIDDFCLSYT